MKFSTFAAFVRAQTFTDANTLTNEDLAMRANVEKDDFALKILEANEDYFGFAYKADLIANQREYPLPASILPQIKKVEVMLDGENWDPIDETDLNFIDAPTNESDIQNAYSGRKAEYGLFGGSIHIYSADAIIDVMEGIKLFAFEYPKDYRADDFNGSVDMSTPVDLTSSALPIAFHYLLALKVIIGWKNGRPKPVKLQGDELKFDDKFNAALKTIKKANLDRAFTAKRPVNYGYQY